MKLSMAILFCSFFLCVSSRSLFTFLREAYQGSRDMMRAYSDMEETPYPFIQEYIISQGKKKAAERGPGGAFAAGVISNAREGSQRITDFFKHRLDGSIDRFNRYVDEYGPSDKDPSIIRPKTPYEQY